MGLINYIIRRLLLIINFNQKITATDNPLIGSGKLDGKGIPPDFFSNMDARMAFVYAWDQDVFSQDVCSGYNIDPVTPIPNGMPYRNPNQKRLPFDLKKSEELFKKLYNGQLWEKGFYLEMIYNEGNEVRGGGLRILAENVSSLNPKFDVKVRAAQWPEYLDNVKAYTMPMFFIGWGPDYPDPDNYVDPFMYSKGYFPAQVSYKNEEADVLILEAKFATDPDLRRKNYFRLQEIWVEDAPGLINRQAIEWQFFRDWMQFEGGFFYNQIFDDPFNNLRYIKKGY